MNNLISSKEVIERAKISRATLNNYIAMGLLPRPVVGQPLEKQPNSPPHVGYFPESVLDRLAEINKLKNEGYHMSQIASLMSGTESGPAAATKAPLVAVSTHAVTAPEPPKLTVEGITHPAYMINHNFELVWFNKCAHDLILGPDGTLPATSEERSVFRTLLTASIPDRNRLSMIRFHMGIAKARLSKEAVLGLCPGLPAEQLGLIESLFDDAEPEAEATIIDAPLMLADASGAEIRYRTYATFFREGIFIIHKEEGVGEETLLEFLARRDEIIRALLSKRLPVLTNVAVLVADLQNSMKICSELPPEEYFELINELYSGMAPIFRKYFGTHGKHAGDGLLYYFFPRPENNYVFNAVSCAKEIKAEMQKMSKAWQIRKNWLNELYLNIGLTEGQEWVGTYQTATSVEFVVLGDTINHAARISDFARYGSIWATKSFIGKLPMQDRQKLRFGVNRTTPDSRQIFIPSSYALVSSLISFEGGNNEKLREIAAFPVTEIVDVTVA